MGRDRNMQREAMTTIDEVAADAGADPSTSGTFPLFDIAAHLDSPKVVAAYLSEFFAEGDPAMIASALNDAARATRMPVVAAKSGLAREAIYKALRPGSQPRMETILRVLKALGYQLVVQPIPDVGATTEELGPEV
jgi:probable addiction module antidote protein